MDKESKQLKVELEILKNNSEVTYRLFKKAKGGKDHVRAFLYFFYNFELSLKHLIMTEMMIKNSLKFIKEKRDIFPIYKADQIKAIREIGKTGNLIGKFNSIFGNQIAEELGSINSERIFLIHKMMKEKISEKEVESYFANFFENTKHDISSAYKYLDTLLDIRPQKLLSGLKREISISDKMSGILPD